MRIGLLISGLLLVIVAAVFAYTFVQNAADPPTTATSPERLARVTLPGDAVPLVTPSDPEADATDLYRRAMGYYRANSVELDMEYPPPDKMAALVDLMLAATQAGQVQDGFLDVQISDDLQAGPNFGDALEGVGLVLLFAAQDRYQAGDKDGAIALSQAVWLLGRRAFEHNTHLYPRITGLTMMQNAGSQLLVWLPPEQTVGWERGLRRIDDAWMAKLPIVSGTKPHIGDLTNIARNDQDPTFRLAATLRLGIAKFNPGTSGNLSAINAAIADAKADEDAKVRRAGLIADEATEAEVRRVH